MAVKALMEMFLGNAPDFVAKGLLERKELLRQFSKKYEKAYE